MDGREHPLGSDGKMVSVSGWSGNTLVNSKRSKDGSFEEEIRLSMSSDGRTAIEKRHIKSPNGTDSRTRVWTRE